ncbi:MAG: protease complex subunit PrcB family protein [bacterium]|nr:protease complex subunit PrcB family protein [bacterium]
MTLKKRRITGKSVLALLLAACVFALSGCTMLSEEKIKLRDLDFTVLSEEKIPKELLDILEEKKASPFQITYTDNENLYICVGYGQQETGGYSIAVEELYLTDANICVNTSLLGPDGTEKGEKTVSYPYIVLKTEFLDLTVVFE